MMANAEIPGTQEQGLAAVPPQGRSADVADVAEAPETSETAPDPAGAATPEVPRPRRESPDAGQPAGTGRAPAVYEPESERLPLMARVLLADLAVAIAALVLLFVIEVQRFGDASLHLRREAWGEDLAVLFGVSLLFGVVTFLLMRAGRTRVAIVQAVVTALVLAAAVTSASTGDPKPSPDTSTTTGSPGNPG